MLLASAKAFLCDIANYEPDSRFNVTRIYGNNDRTICKVVVVQPDKHDELPTLEKQYCDDNGRGDGTVPMWIAAEDKRPSADADKARPAAKDHAELLGSREFIEYLRSYEEQLHREMQRAYLEKGGNIDGLVRMYAALKYVVPSDIASNADDPTKKVARAVLAKLNISPNSLYTFAKTTPDPLWRADAYRLFADTSNINNSNHAWALNNAAHIFLNQGDFASAIKYGKSAIKAADFSSNNAVKAKAALTTAVAAEKLRNTALAKSYGTLAVKYGNPKAAGFLVK